MISNNVYLFIGGVTGTVSSWVVPAGVTGIKVECYGGLGLPSSFFQGSYYGGSYSCINNLAVTGGQTITFQMPAFNATSSTWASTTGVAPTSTTQGCLAVSGAIASASQIASNIGDIKFAGGNASPSGSGNWRSGAGGQAGSSGPGADAGSVIDVVTTQNNTYDVYRSGGASGGTTSTSSGVIPAGRYNSATVGNGNYGNAANPTRDNSITASYVNGLLQNNLYVYGAHGGPGLYIESFGDSDVESLQGAYPGFIVITLIAGRKYIVVNTTGSSTFTAPSDFDSLVSLEAIGAGGNGDNATSGTSRYGGGGGGGYSKNTGASASIVAGSTTIYTSIPAGGAASACSLRIGNSGTPTSTDGVLANSGGNASLNTAGTGASTTGAVGTSPFTYAGGAGGAGSTTTRLNAGGGGGAAGPLGAGGVGGAANNNGANRGGGGGGGANNGGNGAAANTTTPFVSGNGGTGSNGASAGGNGNTAANISAATNGASGASAGSTVGGGGGGGNGFNNSQLGAGGFVDNGVYRIGGGPGGFSTTVRTDGSFGNYPGAGGSGRSSGSSNHIGGQGLVVMAYTPKITYTNGNFFQFL
jgi:hypothetical protein